MNCTKSGVLADAMVLMEWRKEREVMEERSRGRVSRHNIEMTKKQENFIYFKARSINGYTTKLKSATHRASVLSRHYSFRVHCVRCPWRGKATFQEQVD